MQCLNAYKLKKKYLFMYRLQRLFEWLAAQKRRYCLMLKCDYYVACRLISHSDVCSVGGSDSQELTSSRRGIKGEDCIDAGLTLLLYDINYLRNELIFGRFMES